ncbi:oligosaccharide flippase family protein, partial [Patescibacteria group bacterium]|nr:oligosaccharide flippase family protein [Patescibacteria group bacterium]
MTMKKYGNFIKNFGILGTANFVVSIRGLLLLPLLTKILGPEQYGMWAQLSITLTLVASIAVLGLPSALVRFLAAEKVRKNIQEGIWSSVFSVLFISLLIVLVFSLFAGAIGEFLHVSSILISILGFIILFESINLIFLNMFRVSQQIGTYSFFIILSLLGEVGLVGISVIWGYGLLGAVVALLLS